MSKWLCSFVGHKPPVYAKRGWYSPGEQYADVWIGLTDNIGRVHAIIFSECPRCGDKFMLCRIHVPQQAKSNE